MLTAWTEFCGSHSAHLISSDRLVVQLLSYPVAHIIVQAAVDAVPVPGALAPGANTDNLAVNNQRTSRVTRENSDGSASRVTRADHGVVLDMQSLSGLVTGGSGDNRKVTTVQLDVARVVVDVLFTIAQSKGLLAWRSDAPVS